jgi:hypothetical protein
VNLPEKFEEDEQDLLIQRKDSQVIDAPSTVTSPNLGTKHLTTDLKIRIIECIANGESFLQLVPKSERIVEQLLDL